MASLFKPGSDLIKDCVAVPQQAADAGRPCGLAIPPVIHRDKGHPHLGVDRTQMVVVRDNFSIAVKKEEVSSLGRSLMDPGHERHTGL